MVRNKSIFEVLIQHRGGRIIEMMVAKLKGEVRDVCHLPSDSDKILIVYIKEVSGMVERWGEEGFREDKIDRTLKDMMFLTTSVKQRLGALRGK